MIQSTLPKFGIDRYLDFIFEKKQTNIFSRNDDFGQVALCTVKDERASSCYQLLQKLLVCLDSKPRGRLNVKLCQVNDAGGW